MLLRVPVGMCDGLSASAASLSGRGGPALKSSANTARTVTDYNFAVIPLFC